MRRTILSFLDDCARRGGDTWFAHRRALRVVRWSYARVAETAYRFARELESRGVVRGDRVLIRAENCPEWVAAFFGCALGGVIVVPLDAESTPDFVARVCEQTRAKLLLTTSAPDGDSAKDERQAVGNGGHVDARQDEFASQMPTLRLDDLEDLVSRHSPTPFHVEDISPDDIVEIIYTSGTTAEPRGVCLTHRNLLANIAPLESEIGKYARWERLTVHPLRFLNLLPLSHVFGQFMGVFVPSLLGGEVHFQNSLNPSEIVDAVRKQRISIVVTVPRLLDTLRDRIERDYDAHGESEFLQASLAKAGGWRFLKRWWVFRRAHRNFGWKFWAFISGGAKLNEETETFWRRLGFAVIQGYGMTETASLITVNHPFKIGRGSIGKALPGQEMKLDERGEILVRGANVSPGYYDGARGRVQTLADADGWLRTGDLGERDAAGNIYFKGRSKETIVTSAGLNVYPEDLEAALDRQPEVRACAVVGVETERGGGEPLAVLILRDETQEDAAARAVERANLTLARHQQIRRWHVWSEQDFPRTPTQKVRKRDILQKIKDEGGRMADEEKAVSDSSFIPHPSSLHFILSTAARIGGSAPAKLGSSANLATDLKLDSLGRVELLSALEDRFQVEIDEAAFTAATTLGDIEQLVRAGGAPEERKNGESAPTNPRVTPYPYPEWAQRFPVTLIRVVLLYLVVLPITSLLCWLRVRGKDKLDALGQAPALFVSNHITYFDHALILSALPGRFRRNFAVAMEGERLRHWRRPPAGTPHLTRLRWLAQYYLVVTFFNTFPLPQKSGFRRSFVYAGETMDRGYSVLVFPEGTRTVDGRMKSFMRGTGLLATHLNAPVVPVRIDGLAELKLSGRRGFTMPGNVTVTFGEPVRYAPDADPSFVAKDLEKRVSEL